MYKNIFISFLLIVIAFLIKNNISLSAQTNAIQSAPTPAPSVCVRPAITRDNIRIALNEQRLTAALPQAADSPILTDYASLRAEEIGDTPVTHETKYKSFWEWNTTNHKGAELRFDNAGGEILVEGYDTSCSSIEAFMASPTHKDIILNPNTQEIGIGIHNSTVVIETGHRKP